MTPTTAERAAAKVPEATIVFWVLKVAATTLGETGGDAVSMSMHLGYVVGTAIFAGLFFAAVTVQIRATRFRPVVYWTTIVATTTVGTTLADFADRSLGIGYAGGASILAALLVASLAAWRWRLGSVAIDTVTSPTSEAFYWVTILFSQTLGTALGDWTADSARLGYGGGVVTFGVALAAVGALYAWTSLSRTTLFWAAFVLTRPLGAVAGDLLDKPRADGGLALSRYAASGALVAFLALGVLVLPQRAARRAH